MRKGKRIVGGYLSGGLRPKRPRRHHPHLSVGRCPFGRLRPKGEISYVSSGCRLGIERSDSDFGHERQVIRRSSSQGAGMDGDVLDLGLPIGADSIEWKEGEGGWEGVTW